MAQQKYRPIPPLTEKDITRFWRHVVRHGPNDCWPWRGTSSYGTIKIQGAVYKANRIAYCIVAGVDPGSIGVCHTCDNPPCCNPSHFMLGDQGINMRDALQKGRFPVGDKSGSHKYPERRTPRRGELNSHAKLTEVAVTEIRHSYRHGVSQRELARRFNVSKHTIYTVVTLKGWKHVLE